MKSKFTTNAEKIKEILSQHYTPIEIKFYIFCSSIFIFQTAIFIFYNSLRDILIINTLFFIFIVLFLQKKIFTPLNSLIKTIYARKIYKATGYSLANIDGFEFDGRKHPFANLIIKTKNKIFNIFKNEKVIPKKNKIIINKKPEYPLLDRNKLGNNEFKYLAEYIDERDNEQNMFINIFSTIIETIPFSVVIILKNGKIYNNNKLFNDLFMHVGTTKNTQIFFDLFENKELIKNIENIIEQKAPRFVSIETTLQTKDHIKKFFLSCSACQINKKKLGVIFIQNIKTKFNSKIEDLITKIIPQSIEKIDITTNLFLADQNNQATISLDNLRDNLNLLLDIINYNTDDIKKMHTYEYNPHNLLNGIKKILINKYNINMEFNLNLPIIAKGNPEHIRQIILFIIDNYIFLGEKEVQLKIEVTKNDFCYKIVFIHKEKNIDKERTSVFEKLCFLYNFTILKKEELNKFEQFGFCWKIDAISEQKHFWHETLAPLSQSKILLIKTDIDYDNISEFLYAANIDKIVSFHIEKLPIELSIDTYKVIIIDTNHTYWHKNIKIRSLLTKYAKQIPIMLSTLYAKRGDADEAYNAGFAAYLRKPFTVEDLSNILLILSNDEALSIAKSRGIITRYLAYDLMQNSGSALIFGNSDIIECQNLYIKLSQIGFDVFSVFDNISFFEKVFSKKYNYIFIPNKISLGFKKQILLKLDKLNVISYNINDNCDSEYIEFNGTGFIENSSDINSILSAIKNTLSANHIDNNNIIVLNKAS